MTAPNGLHLGINQAVTAAGKHLACEKPVGPAHPFHGNFNPAPGCGLGYDDLKLIEAHNFLRGVIDGVQGEAGFADVARVARVQQAVLRSWDSGAWSMVDDQRLSPGDHARRFTGTDYLSSEAVLASGVLWGCLTPGRSRRRPPTR